MPMRPADFAARYGPWAVVAGASEGLGAEFATQLAMQGLNLVLVARRADRLDELATQLAASYGAQVRTLALDLGHADAAVVITTQTADIEVGLLVYNAARSVIGPFLERPLQDHLNELDVNCRAPVTLAQARARPCRRRRWSSRRSRRSGRGRASFPGASTGWRGS